MAYSEQRINLLGWLHSRVMHSTYTDDGECLRVISLREAEKHGTSHDIKTVAR